MSNNLPQTPAPAPLPCPFCGMLPIVTKHFKDQLWCLLHRCRVMGGMNLDWNDSDKALIERWNTRSPVK